MYDRTAQLAVHYLREASISLFRDAGLTFEPTDGPDFAPDITAVIGFAGNGIAGALAISSSAACLRALSACANTEYGEDWLGELSNQLLGRFKRRVASYGVTLEMGTPLVVTGERLRVAEPLDRRRALRQGLISAAGRVEVLLEFELRDGFELSAQPRDDGSLAEGDTLLF